MIFLASLLFIVGVMSANDNNNFYQGIYFPAEENNRLNKPSHVGFPFLDPIFANL